MSIYWSIISHPHGCSSVNRWYLERAFLFIFALSLIGIDPFSPEGRGTNQDLEFTTNAQSNTEDAASVWYFGVQRHAQGRMCVCGGVMIVVTIDKITSMALSCKCSSAAGPFLQNRQLQKCLCFIIFIFVFTSELKKTNPHHCWCWIISLPLNVLV